MDRKEMIDFFNKQPRLGAMATADREGNTNAAVFSALKMVDEERVVMAIGENRTLRNLRENPKATFIFFEPASDPLAWKGARLYFDVVSIEESGELFDSLVEEVRKMAGDMAAANVKAAVTFSIGEIRHLIDMG